ncbi:unnamed protein product [Notodromas monacha]|uniref:Trafficking protein particle complex subunit n=1 Tax=Notodromas monacha TaxID=399045 RepID=A0A7R9BEB6_9CRUS|nr:unnamed protein product [Notodromas monacha]CAG0912572.1 unnamed protein product [Notodromas monacha]
MSAYNMYVFGKNGLLLHYSEWNRKRRSNMTLDEEAKLMYGSLFSLKNFCRKVSPLDFKDGFMCYKTTSYMLSVLETLTGLKFVINTDLNLSGTRSLLEKIYSEVFVEYVVKNPMWQIGQPIQSELFKTKLHEVVNQHVASVQRS